MKEKLLQASHMVASLSANELDVLRQYLTAFDTRKGRYKPKTLILLDLLVKYDVAKVEQLLPKRLDVQSADATRMIIQRLKEKIAESLLLDVNINRTGDYDELFKSRVALSKKKMVSEIYRSRGLVKEKLELYDQMIKKAKKYELYEDLVQVLQMKKEHVGLREGEKAFNKLNEEIAFYEGCREAVNHAKNAYYTTIQNYAFKGLNRNVVCDTYAPALEREIKDLKQMFERSTSATVGYYYYLLQIEYFQVRHEYHKASEYCQYFIDIVRNNPSVYLTRRLGIGYLNLSQNEIFNHSFEYAAGIAQQAKDCFIADSKNHALAIELDFYASFYRNQLPYAQEIMQQLIDNKKADQSEFRISWRSYLLACTHFAMGNYKKTHNILQLTGFIDKDKEGWNIGIRTLNIINGIERKLFDYSDSQIVNMQQFIRQSLKHRPVRERDQVILKLLLELRKYSYDFVEVARINCASLELLASCEDGVRWEPQSPELIVFHKWFEAKLNNKPYSNNYSKANIYSLNLQKINS